MKPNARRIATWIIALVLVTLLYQYVSEDSSLLAGGFGAIVLFVGFLFRRTIFRSFHRGVDKVVDKQAEKLFAVGEEQGQPFDADAAFVKYMANRQVEAEEPKDRGSFVKRPHSPTFGRKGQATSSPWPFRG